MRTEGTNSAVIRQMFDQDTTGSTWAVVFDSVLSEDCTLSAVITKEPIAQGSPISDHAYDEQPQVSITVVISNVTPLELLGGRSLEQREQEGTAALMEDPFAEPGRTRSQVAVAKLATILESHQLATLVLGLKTFQNMFMSKIHWTTDERTAEVVEATLDFVGAKITRVSVTTYPPRSDLGTHRAASKTKKEKKEAKTPSLEERKEAYYQRLLGYGFSPELARKMADDAAKDGLL